MNLGRLLASTNFGASSLHLSSSSMLLFQRRQILPPPPAVLRARRSVSIRAALFAPRLEV